MKKWLSGLFSLFFISLFLLANPSVYAKMRVKVTPDQTTINIGESVTFTAYLDDGDGNITYPDFSWSLTKQQIGTITTEGVFTALESGAGHVVATVDGLSGKAKVTVCRDTTGNGKWKLEIIPGDTAIVVGQTLNFSALKDDSTDATLDTTFVWSLSDSSVATIDASGYFEALEKGNTFVYGTTADAQGKTHVTILHDTTELNNNNKLKIVVVPHDTTLNKGETLQYSAVLLDADSTQIDTSFTWSFDDDEVGEIGVESGLFTALDKGNGFVYAHVGDLSGRGHVVVKDTAQSNGKVEGTILRIFPQDTTVFIGDQVQYTASILDTLTGTRTDTTADYWYRVGNDVGDIDWDGLFTADDKGNGVIKAKLGNYTATTHVIVLTPGDVAEADTVKLRFRDRDGEQIGNIHRNSEKDIVTISGLPFPLSVLNGGKIIFTAGSLDESISIDISLSTSAFVVDDSTVTFADQILNGISFHVYVNDVLVSPYYFDEPVSLVLPYKEELLDTLGLDPEDLWIFFYEDSASFNSDGITNVVVDEDAGKIYADVIHFSDLVIADKTSPTTGIPSSKTLPVLHTLYANYPNPFNPETSILFDIGGTQQQKVRLTIYNLVGQRVRELVNTVSPAGSYSVLWNGKDNKGIDVGSGVYIYRLQIGNKTQSRRMILLR